MLDVYYGTAYGAALFDELDYFCLCLLRLVELAGSALEVVVLDVDDESSFFHIHISLMLW